MSTSSLPLDHEARLGRARLSLDGLAVGDSFGSQFFLGAVWETALPVRGTPPGRWRFTDDTMMALGICEVLHRHGRIDQDDLARTFFRRFDADTYRGYGPAMFQVLPAIGQGVPWREAAGRLFGGAGSMGNGAAMRVAPVGAYFADDFDAVVREARASAEVTHLHPEGVAGAIAGATAAAYAWRAGQQSAAHPREEMLDAVLDHTPEGRTRAGIERALELGLHAEADWAAHELGNGSRVTAPDTVPFTLWAAARHLHEYGDALWTTVAVGGDVDTTCAIVGGIVVLAAGRASIPADWLAAQERR